MTGRKQKALTGVVVDARATLTLSEFCQLCDVEVELVREMVVEGVVEPKGRRIDEWRFSNASVYRAQRALRLVRDLRVNWPGAALALDLLERLEERDRNRRG